jgi:glycosyltransferase involved in cell wall biosynthesis
LKSGAKSSPEHFGITISEAMASGCVPVVPNVGGPREIVGANEEHGLMFGDVVELKSKVSMLLRDEGLWSEMHRRALKRVGDFDVKVIGERVKHLLDQTL